MRRTSLIVHLPSLALAAALLAGTGCVVHLGNWSGNNSDVFGHSVSEGDDGLTVDGTRLPFDRWVEVSTDVVAAGPLEIGTATDTVRLEGTTAPGATLKAHLYSEIEGDGAAVIENGRLVAQSQAGGVVFINSVVGTVPAAVTLNAHSGTGAVDVSGLNGTTTITVTGGTGDLSLRASHTGTVKVESGTGMVTLEDLDAASLGIDGGTSDMKLVRCKAPTMTISSGTGDATLDACEATSMSVETGTGDASLVGCQVGTLTIESGTGDLLLDGGKADHVEFSTGTGDLTQRNGVLIGSLKET